MYGLCSRRLDERAVLRDEPAADLCSAQRSNGRASAREWLRQLDSGCRAKDSRIQPWDGEWGTKTKDRLEVKMKTLV